MCYLTRPYPVLPTPTTRTLDTLTPFRYICDAAGRLALAGREGMVLPWPSIFFMYLLYLDHAGAIEDPAQKHFVLAGVSVFERQTYWISQELDSIAARFNSADPASIELHGSPMHGGRGKKWRCFTVQDRVRAMSDALAAFSRSHATNTLFGVAVKKPIDDPGAAVTIAFERICNMFDKHLLQLHRQKNTQRGLIIFDKATYETEIQSLAIDFRSVGHTWGVVTNLSEVPLFLDSKASRLVQLADLVAFSLYRYHEAQDSRFIDIIQGRFDGPRGARNLVHIPSVTEWATTKRLSFN